METYGPYEFARLIGKSVQTLQRGYRERIQKAHRSKTNRRYSYRVEKPLEYVRQVNRRANQLVHMFEYVSGNSP
jgi:hypothetical protein